MWQDKDDERRKVQFTGGSTYIISLPKKWIAVNQLKKGSFVKFREEEGGLLTIIPPEVTMQRKIDIAIVPITEAEDIEIIMRKIISVYLSGYNSINIRPDKHGFSTRLRQEIKSNVRKMLVGAEIVIDNSTRIELQILLAYPQFSILGALRRMSIITVSMHQEALLSLKMRDRDQASEVKSTDSEVDRFNLYITRILKGAISNPKIAKEIGLSKSNDCLGIRLITQYVERAADHAVNIVSYTENLKSKSDDSILLSIEQMSKTSLEMFENAMESLFRQDYASAQKVFKLMDQVRNLEEEAKKNSKRNPDDEGSLRLIIESIRRTAEYSCDIAEIVLNLTVDSILGYQ